jgi:hypothetical protein
MSGPKLPKGNIHPNLDAVSTCPTARANSEPGQVFGLGQSSREGVKLCASAPRVCVPRPAPSAACCPCPGTQQDEAAGRSETGDRSPGRCCAHASVDGERSGGFVEDVCMFQRTFRPSCVSRTLQSEQTTLQAGTKKKKMNKSFANRAPVLLPNRAMYFGPEHVSTNGHTHAPSDKPELQRRSIQELL